MGDAGLVPRAVRRTVLLIGIDLIHCRDEHR